MQRRVGLAVVLVVVAIVIAVLGGLRLRGRGPAPGAAHGSGAAHAAVAAAPRPRVDPRALTRGSIAGTVRDQAGAPIAHARVCGNAWSSELPDSVTAAPICADTDERGGYKLGDLIAAEYTVQAAAPRFRPAVFEPTPGAAHSEFALAAGEARTGIDLVLRPGGVELTGTVLDIAGGPIAHAQVRTTRGLGGHGGGPTADTDERGQFSLWVDPGTPLVSATADGYASNVAMAHAPGAVEILLTPESSLAGTVIDAATDQPVAGARVEVATAGWGWDGNARRDFTDEHGRFRVSPLGPGRFVASATAEHGYGTSRGSILVGLGQHVDGVIVAVFPAHRITGRVVIAASRRDCPDATVFLRDPLSARMFHLRRGPGDRLVGDGVTAGSYRASVNCTGYRERDTYDPVVVADADVDATWEVDAGATIRGKVTTRSGTPVDDANVSAQRIGEGRTPTSWLNVRARPGGEFELTGLAPSRYRVRVSSDHGVAPVDGVEVEVAAGATVERDLVLDGVATLSGTVVDGAGAPVGGVQIHTSALQRSWSNGPGLARSDAAGAFTIEGLRPGDYRVTAARSYRDTLRRPGTNDDAEQGERVSLRAGQTATVRLVVEAPSGSIRGSVLDAAGAPVTDAFVACARESDAAGGGRSSVAATRDDWWGNDAKPVLTGTDGSFVLGHLAPGAYTLRAYRKGGGEAIAEHVAVGGTATLRIKPTGSIDGVARGQTAPVTLRIALRDRATGVWRSESFFRTDGHFTVTDLPAGHFELTAQADATQASITVDLGDGEAKTGVSLALDALVTMTGRVVEYGTQRPVSGIYAYASSLRGGATMVQSTDDGRNITDDGGRFTIANVAVGKVSITLAPKDDQGSEYSYTTAIRALVDTGTGAIDVGDLGMIRRRVKPGQPVGQLGLHLAPPAPGAALDQRELKITWIDPAGPAASSGLQIGDVFTSVDGIDVTGDNQSMWWPMTQAPPGTRLALGTRRGVTATIVLAAP